MSPNSRKALLFNRTRDLGAHRSQHKDGKVFQPITEDRLQNILVIFLIYVHISLICGHK